MTRKFALISTGPLSGKSELAKALEKNYGYLKIEFSKLVAQLFCDWMNKSRHYSPPMTVADVYADKERWRQDLQTYATSIGFDDPAAAPTWINLALRPWRQSPIGTPVVIDSIRNRAQVDYMRDIDFTIVQLSISEAERERRAKEIGRDYQEILASMRARPDLELGINDPDITLLAHYPPDDLARMLAQGMFTGGKP